MITKICSILNKQVMVTYSNTPDCVIVNNPNIPGIPPQIFSGFDGIKEMFESYQLSFSEQTDLQTTLDFFKPNIQPTVVNASGN